MSAAKERFYPGESAKPAELLMLADEYRRSAEVLLKAGRSKAPLSWAPYRLVAIHAIELYLNACLLSAGHSQVAVRSLQHDTATRTRMADIGRLRLRKRTSAHLETLSRTREYLVARYDPGPTATSHLNRLQATLTEVAKKVHAATSSASPMDGPDVAATDRTVREGASRGD